MIHDYLEIKQKSDLQLVDSIFSSIRDFNTPHFEFVKNNSLTTLGVSFEENMQTLLKYNLKKIEQSTLKNSSYILHISFANLFEDFEENQADFNFYELNGLKPHDPILISFFSSHSFNSFTDPGCSSGRRLEKVANKKGTSS